MNTPRRKLIVLDGADRIGKKTATAKTTLALQVDGLSVATMSFPDYETYTGKLIADYLAGQFGDPTSVAKELASPLYLLNRLERKRELEEKIAQHDVTILDRYVPANLLLQGAKEKDAALRRAFVESWQRLEYDTFGLPRPNLVILLRGNPRLSFGLERGAKDGHEKNFDYQQRVDEYTSVLVAEQSWQEVSTTTESGFRPKEAIAADIVKLIKFVL